jgi:hypothetical protein
LLGFSQCEGEKEGRPLGAAAIVRDLAPYDVTCKQQRHFRFRMSIIESGMSCHIREQLGYDQPKLPTAFALKPQIIR